MRAKRFRERSSTEPHFAWHQIIEGSGAVLAHLLPNFFIQKNLLAVRATLQLDVRGDAQVLPLSVGFHLREIILFHETDCVAAEQ
jgi:hypothetical protein